MYVEETSVHGEFNPSVTDKLNHIKLYRVHSATFRFDLSTLVLIGRLLIGTFVTVNPTTMIAGNS
jgi:hypothetical protein